MIFLADFNGLVQVIKKVAVEAVEAGKPTGISYGEVISTTPLQIKMEQKMILTATQLLLTKEVVDYTTYLTMEWETEEDTETHCHGDSRN